MTRPGGSRAALCGAGPMRSTSSGKQFLPPLLVRPSPSASHGQMDTVVASPPGRLLDVLPHVQFGEGGVSAKLSFSFHTCGFVQSNGGAETQVGWTAGGLFVLSLLMYTGMLRTNLFCPRLPDVVRLGHDPSPTVPRGEEESHPAVADARGREGCGRGRGSVGGRVLESGSEVDTGDDDAQPEGGDVPGRRRTRSWLLEERIDLARFMKEDDAMMQMASGRLKHARRSVRNEWVSKKMKAAGWSRLAEDCMKKWCDLMSKMKDILHKCNASGKPSYWEMSVEDRKREGILTTFEQPLWEEMEWAQRKSPVACDNTMASSNLQGFESRVSDKETPGGHGSSEGGSRSGASVEESEGLRKKRRRATGKDRASVHLPVSSMERVVLDSSMAVREGMDMAASTLARASTEGAKLVATQVGALKLKNIEYVKSSINTGLYFVFICCAVQREQQTRGLKATSDGEKFEGEDAQDIDSDMKMMKRLLRCMAKTFYFTRAGDVEMYPSPSAFVDAFLEFVGTLREDVRRAVDRVVKSKGIIAITKDRKMEARRREEEDKAKRLKEEEDRKQQWKKEREEFEQELGVRIDKRLDLICQTKGKQVDIASSSGKDDELSCLRLENEELRKKVNMGNHQQAEDAISRLQHELSKVRKRLSDRRSEGDEIFALKKEIEELRGSALVKSNFEQEVAGLRKEINLLREQNVDFMDEARLWKNEALRPGNKRGSIVVNTPDCSNRGTPRPRWTDNIRETDKWKEEYQKLQGLHEVSNVEAEVLKKKRAEALTQADNLRRKKEEAEKEVLRLQEQLSKLTADVGDKEKMDGGIKLGRMEPTILKLAEYRAKLAFPEDRGKEKQKESTSCSVHIIKDDEAQKDVGTSEEGDEQSVEL
ncbi:hypothetical protein CBR_g10957 [Chara braunii]|uniref:Myb-like domain-containing protein n=1 Tax=Chara braunii TaxID=69332 RepID=A0A388KPP0_CHABU|nr:hypothetical protein CBR_g10957 [Chara braunii]|eukprot:GBG72021.1 hypothetical protein CBR_g10957 [Chara braunii]